MEITASQAARKYGVFPHVLYRMILMGRIRARKDEDGRWRITTESLERWNRQRVRRAAKLRPEAPLSLATPLEDVPPSCTPTTAVDSPNMKRRLAEEATAAPLFAGVQR